VYLKYYKGLTRHEKCLGSEKKQRIETYNAVALIQFYLFPQQIKKEQNALFSWPECFFLLFRNREILPFLKHVCITAAVL